MHLEMFCNLFYKKTCNANANICFCLIIMVHVLCDEKGLFIREEENWKGVREGPVYQSKEPGL